MSAHGISNESSATSNAKDGGVRARASRFFARSQIWLLMSGR